jgi:hypothetical protein
MCMVSPVVAILDSDCAQVAQGKKSRKDIDNMPLTEPSSVKYQKLRARDTNIRTFNANIITNDRCKSVFMSRSRELLTKFQNKNAQGSLLTLVESEERYAA